MEVNKYLKSVLGGLNDALTDTGYETCKEEDAHIAIDIKMDTQNSMFVSLRKRS